MTVKAPIGGTVVTKNNITGDTVQAGKSILTIVDTNDIRIKVAVDELDISKVVKGQKAEVKFDALKDKVYEGTVENIGITGNTSNNVTTYDVIVSV
jgi:HlyD family secretion protein